jgi:hypothetical protein
MAVNMSVYILNNKKSGTKLNLELALLNAAMNLPVLAPWIYLLFKLKVPESCTLFWVCPLIFNCYFAS